MLLKLVLVFICISIFIIKFISYKEGYEHNITIVISRYNENLEWIKMKPFNKYPIICYNSGEDNNFYKQKNMKIIKINNIGKEVYSYLYHIIHFYDNLSNITIFLPGSTNHPRKINKAKQQIYEIEKNNKTVFIGTKMNNIQKDLYDFNIDTYCSSDSNNLLKNAECELYPSTIKPFGLWYKFFFGEIITTHFNTCGILGIEKKHIIQKPKEYYQKLLNELNHPNDEVAHYFERSWEAIFYPMKDAIYIDKQAD